MENKVSEVVPRNLVNCHLSILTLTYILLKKKVVFSGEYKTQGVPEMAY
jgi:hypothetical protein